MKNPVAKFRKLKPVMKAAFWLGGIALGYTLFGFLGAPLILKSVLEKKLPQILHRTVSVEKIRLNPFVLSVTVEGFRLAEKGGTGEFVSFDRLHVNFESLSVFKKALILRSVSLTRPKVEISRLDEQTYSFSDLLKNQDEPTEPASEKAEKALFSINNIEIIDGSIRYHDLPKGADHHIEDLTLAIPSISNLPSNIETSVQPVFSAVINGTPVSLAGGSKPFTESRATEIDLKISGIDIPEYLGYIPNPTALTVKSALLDIDTRLTYRLLPDQASRLSLTGTVTLRRLEVTDREGRSYLRLPAVSALLADSNLLAGEIRLAGITVEAPQLEMTRLADGKLLPFALLAPAESSPAEAPPTEGAAPAADPLRLTIDRFRINNGVVVFNDRGLKKPALVRIHELGVTVENLSTVPATTGKLDFSLGVNQNGRLSGSGTFALDPLAVQTSLAVESLKLSDFQPYIAEHARIILTDGTFALQGTAELRPAATGNSAFSFAGNCAIADLATTDAMSGNELLKWKSLRIGNIAYSTVPDELSIEEIRLEDLFASVRINDAGTPNLATLVEEPAAADTLTPAGNGAASGAGAERKISIGRVVTKNGRVQFIDSSIKPSYAVSLDQLNGTVTGLSTHPGNLATVKLDAKFDQQAPLLISGSINPLSSKPVADVNFDLKDFNLSPLSPYTGKYVGNKIAKGKLNFNLRYRIRENLLDSSNKVFLDQFTLGEAVESPDATALPVNLAIALLKNRRGEIFLDLPVSGDLNDPEFRYGRVVIQVLVNLISKAATSPLTLLGSLIPEGTDLQHVLFAPGLGELSATEAEKLALVANVLHERPGLRMDIAGHADPQLDRQALAKADLLKLVKLEKLREAGTPKGAEAELQNIVVSAEEYPRYLQLAYTQGPKSAPEAEKALLSQAPPAGEAEAVARMEEFLLRSLKVEDEDLRLLALARANTVLTHLTGTGKVEAERLFVLEPQLTAAGSEEKQESQTAADLLIK